MAEEFPHYIEFRNVYKTFDRPVLVDVSFHVDAGQTLAIIGRSGVGKSVSLGHIMGFLKPDSGKVIVSYTDITSAPEAELRRIRKKVTMVFQSGALFDSLTVGENVGLYLTEHQLKPPEEIARIVAENLEIVGLQGSENKMPSELSGGMKKRVAIARALVVEPQLILYDEPTSELDPLSAVVIGAEILNLKERIKVTSLVVSHDRDLAFGVADRIAVIHEGRILAVGTPDEIKRLSNPLIQKFLNVDFKHLEPSDAKSHR